MKQYLDLLMKVYKEGQYKPDRTGTGTSSLFGYQLEFDLTKGFPIVTTKKIFVKSLVTELLWMLRGDSNLSFLHEHDVHIWDEWANEQGDLGPIYGVQWRSWSASDGRHIDQIQRVVEQIKNNPFSRRHVVSAWNVGDLGDMALQPCHVMFQFNVSGRKKLSCHMYQRSADVFLGLPFNISSYALLTHMIGQVTGYEPEKLVISLGDVHLYMNHVKQAKTQLTRKPYDLPRLKLNESVKDITKFTHGDIELENYQYHPHIKAPIAV